MFSDAAAKQLEAITDEAELHGLDRVLVVLSIALDIGALSLGRALSLRQDALVVAALTGARSVRLEHLRFRNLLVQLFLGS